MLAAGGNSCCRITNPNQSFLCSEADLIELEEKNDAIAAFYLFTAMISAFFLENNKALELY